MASSLCCPCGTPVVENPVSEYETLGLLAGAPVSIVHTETEDEIRVISLRKAVLRAFRDASAFVSPRRQWRSCQG